MYTASASGCSWKRKKMESPVVVDKYWGILKGGLQYTWCSASVECIKYNIVLNNVNMCQWLSPSPEY